MTALLNFTGRNIKNYLRDRSAVFFSFLSMIILIVLMVAFLGDAYTDGIADHIKTALPELDAEAIEADCSYYITMCTLGSVLLINCVSISMMMMGSMIRDEATGKLAVFYSTPVKRWILSLGYIMSSWLATFGLSICTLAFTEGFLAVTGKQLLSFAQIYRLSALLALFSLTFSAISMAVATFFHSMGSWSALQTIVGTLSGFLAGSYVPVSSFGDGLQTVLRIFPFLQGAAALRTVCTEQILQTGFVGVPEEIKTEIGKEVGNILVSGTHTYQPSEQIIILAVYGALAISATVLITLRRRAKEL